MTTKRNPMDAFLERYGILKSWVAEAAGLPIQTFNGALWIRGFRPEESARMASRLNAAGRELLRFRFGSNSVADLDKLKANYGIKRAWLAAQLGIAPAALGMASQRIDGFRPEEKEILELALKDIARAMISFEMPQSLKKAA